MPQVDVKWPSEDEDFDAKTAAAKTEDVPATATADTEDAISDVAPPMAPAGPPAAKAPAPNPAPMVSMPQNTSAKLGMGRKKMFHFVVELVLLAALVGVGLWGWNLKSDRDNLQKQYDSVIANPQALVEKQTQDLISKVGQLINLPTGETPTVANVSDAAKAKQQSAFFANAQNGDKVLMYVKAGEAILYRPSTNKIILVAPLTFNGSTTPAAH